MEEWRGEVEEWCGERFNTPTLSRLIPARHNTLACLVSLSLAARHNTSVLSYQPLPDNTSVLSYQPLPDNIPTPIVPVLCLTLCHSKPLNTTVLFCPTIQTETVWLCALFTKSPARALDSSTYPHPQAHTPNTYPHHQHVPSSSYVPSIKSHSHIHSPLPRALISSTYTLTPARALISSTYTLTPARTPLTPTRALISSTYPLNPSTCPQPQHVPQDQTTCSTTTTEPRGVPGYLSTCEMTGQGI
ncbi:hypothetical protein Pcinc_041795 [Petrolisthes cinctipes]|uniref:Uncharacterized protein n=1 Tax=Petrolisthes cinctipes TaxID=88211 RepID=A0AAE1BJF5_PETCI|nr:hypothetical protein Pcinc_041795 [Petrolisthes cinctipes]